MKVKTYPLDPTPAMRPPARTVRLERGTRGGLVMVTNVGKKQGAYSLKEIPAVGFNGRGFQLEKLFGGTDAESTGYAVFVSNEGHHSCHCKGHLRHGHCTHVEALQELIEAGELPPQLTPTPVIPVPAKRLTEPLLA